MPLTPLVATAVALSTDDTMHNLPHDSVMEIAQHAHTTAFIQLPLMKQKLLDLLIGPEISAYHWAEGKAHAIYDQLFGPAVAPPAAVAHPDQGRMVEYFASACPHCKHLDPVWHEASQLWAKQGNEESHRIAWEQKQCLDDNWKPGPDYEECKAAEIAQFPTIKFFLPGSKVGEDYYLDRTPEALVDFAKTGIHPNPEVMPRDPDDEADFKLVDFFAGGCHHCKALDPIWEDAHKEWDRAIGQTAGEPREDLPLVSFEKRECYDERWNPGKDANECQQYHVDSFPTIKLFGPDPHGHGFVPVDYTGARTPKGIVEFLARETGTQLDAAKLPGASHPDPEHVMQADVQPSLIMPAKADAVGLGSESNVQLGDENVNVDVVASQPEDNLNGMAHGDDSDKYEVNVTVGNADENLIASGDDSMDASDVLTPADLPRLESAGDDSMNNASDSLGSAGADLPQPLREAVKVAMLPLPMLTMSCLPVRKNSMVQAQRTHNTFEHPPSAIAEFL